MNILKMTSDGWKRYFFCLFTNWIFGFSTSIFLTCVMQGIDPIVLCVQLFHFIISSLKSGRSSALLDVIVELLYPVISLQVIVCCFMFLWFFKAPF